MTEKHRELTLNDVSFDNNDLNQSHASSKTDSESDDDDEDETVPGRISDGTVGGRISDEEGSRDGDSQKFTSDLDAYADGKEEELAAYKDYVDMTKRQGSHFFGKKSIHCFMHGFL